MFESIKKNYNHTIKACYLGYITQAIVNNFVPLLFITFATDYSLGLDKITLLTTLNFCVQLLVDLISTRYADKLGYRTYVVFGHICSALGLVGLAFLPELLPNAFAGILISVVLYAIGGGIIEVLISPIVEACPTENKEKAMSLLHSFYCWGHVFVIIVSTAFFHFIGIDNWKILSCIWGIVPLFNAFYFLLVPIFPINGEGEKPSMVSLFKNKTFYLFIVLMICAGASEQAVSQWVSAFAEKSLGITKTLGDMAGPCAFAFFMGLSRLIYGKHGEKMPLKKMMVLSCLMCIASYLLIILSPWPVLSLIGCALTGFAVGLFWPGTFSLAAVAIPGGGTAMYALLAFAGDVGCSSGPTVVGLTAHALNENLKNGIGVAMIFPILMLLGIIIVKNKKKNSI